MGSTEVEALDDGLEYNFENSDVEEGFSLQDEESTALDGATEGDKQENDLEGDEEETVSGGKKRKRKNDKFHEKKRVKMEYDIEFKKNLSKESREIISENLIKKIKFLNPDLSPLELSELYLDKYMIEETTSFTKDRNLKNLEEFLMDKNFKFKDIINKKRFKNDKKEFVVILSMSAIRSCDIHRASREVKDSSIKIINKNKLSNDFKILKLTKSKIIAATPGRIIRVLNEKDSNLEYNQINNIILDSSYLDTKNQNIFDLKETIKLLKDISNNNSNLKIFLY